MQPHLLRSQDFERSQSQLRPRVGTVGDRQSITSQVTSTRVDRFRIKDIDIGGSGERGHPVAQRYLRPTSVEDEFQAR